MYDTSTSKSFIIPVYDKTPPEIFTPSKLIVNANSWSKAFVDYKNKVSAKDDHDLQTFVSCTPASGSMFRANLTNVNCTAKDKAGNIGLRGFPIILHDTTSASKFMILVLDPYLDVKNNIVAESSSPVDPNFDQADNNPKLTIDKEIIGNNFTSPGPVQIRINTKNIGQVTARNIRILDYFPADFLIFGNQSSIINQNRITFDKIALAPGEIYSVSYLLLGNAKMNDDIQVNLSPAELYYTDGSNNSFSKKSDQTTFTMRSHSSFPDMVLTIIVLIIVSFMFGGLGALIHWNVMKTKEFKKYVFFLLGGMAGVLVLGALEGLSQLFTNGQFVLTPQNMIILVSTCFAAGYVPLDVIDKATQKWQVEADKQEQKAEEGEKGVRELSNSITKLQKTIKDYETKTVEAIIDKENLAKLAAALTKELKATNQKLNDANP